MSESLLRRILRDHQAQRRTIALILCLSMVLSLGIFSGLRKDAIAKTYTRVVLECPYMAKDAPQVVHTHNDDCYDEYGNLACTLPELEAHTHGDDCFTEVKTLVCSLEENFGHVHSDACYTAETTLDCTLEESEGHQHTEDCYTLERGDLLCENTDEEHEHSDECFAWNEVLSCGMEAGEGAHTHSEDCYRTDMILTCGMEEGEGAHTHTEDCYLVERVLTCDKPEIVLHIHTEDCYQKNEDGSIYVDEDGYSWLICGQQEIIEHVHDENCFAVYEMDDGEPEETEEASKEIAVTDETAAEPTEAEVTDEAESTTTEADNTDDAEATEEKDESKEPTELTESEENKEEAVPAVAMPAQSFEKTAGGIKVSVEAPEGAFPENTRMSVQPVNGSGLVDTVSDAVNGEILEVQAVDITFYDADDNEIEPATAIRVSIVPADSQYSEEKANVVHIDDAGEATAVEQAEGTTEDNSEVVFDVETFSIYAIVYTVHFEYEVDGQVYTSSMPGAQDKLLSELIRELNVVSEEQFADFMTKIAKVSISNPEVLKITEIEGDWTIRPLKDSEEVEALTIVMQDGATFRITVEAEGITEVRTEDETAVISTVNDLYLPEEASATAEMLDEEKSESAIAAVQQAAAPTEEKDPENAEKSADATAGTNYQAFSVGLENVDVEGYEGFNVSVTLPEDAVVGRDFQLYQVKEDGTATDLTESLTVTSEPNEDGLQTVSELSFTTNDFADYVLCYSIETYYTDYKGDTFKITLNYGPNACIPDGAELKVSEILPGDEVYQQYLDDSAAKLGVESNAVSFARFFDIEILKDDEKIEPLKPVQVTIAYQDALELSEEQKLSVIHFAEEGTEVITEVSVNDEATEITYEQNSFSVTATLITAEMLDHPSVEGLDGLSATISNGSWYLCGRAIEEIEGSSPAQLVKTNNAADATQWYFEKVEGGYYIYTLINGVKKYLNINPTGNGTSAHVTLGENLNVLTVSGSSPYEISRKIDNVTYYINRWNGDPGNNQPPDPNKGFAGYYIGGDYTKLNFNFSLQGENEQYAVIIKHHLDDENRNAYYMVQNDGSLMEVDYSEEKNEVYLDYPMLWNLSSENVTAATSGGYSGAVTNLRIPTEASGFYGNQLPSGYYYRYINPNTADGITEEAKQGEAEDSETKVKADAAHPGYVWDCRIIYDNVNHRIQGYANYIGIDTNNMKIVGNVTQQNAAEVYLAKVTSVPPSNNLNHTVNHIDISIKGGATLTVPLAYGVYHYYVDNEVRTLTVLPDSDVTLKLTMDQIDISPDDMKTAEITAYSQKNGILNDAFYITGYSQNMRTNASDPATAQVRIEGSFKVSDLDPYPADPNKTTEANENALTEKQLLDRKNNRIYYTVTASKEVSFPWLYEYEKGKKAQLYLEGVEKKSTVMVNLSKSFDYWDPDNECPPIKDLGGFDDWERGHIIWNTANGDGSGMDFKLEAHAELSGDVAIEIYKYLRTNEGDILQPKTDVTSTFVVYQKTPASISDINSVINAGMGEENPQVNYNGYTGLHAKSITVGSSGEGMVHDYDVDEGMTYVIEDENSIPKSITDINGQKWKYISTRTETEYAWRTAEDYDGKRHVVDGLTSIPDVVGNYGTWVNSAGEEEPLFNRFLEFHVYNIYEKEDEVVTLPVEKTWADFQESDYKWTARFQLQYIEKKISGDGEDKSVTEWTNYTPEKILTIHKDAVNQSTVQATFGDLPKYRVDENGNKYERQYSAEELDFTVWKVVGSEDVMLYRFDGVNYTYGNDADETAVYKPFYDHDANENWDNNWTLKISNSKSQEIEPRKINLTLKKVWAPTIPADASANFVLKRYVQNEYVDYTGKQTNPNITVELRDQNDRLLSSVQTKSGMNVYIDATFAPNKTGTLSFEASGTSYSVSNITSSATKITVRSDPITVTGTEGDTVVVKLINGDVSTVQEGSAYNLRITDHLTGTIPSPDGYSQTINLPVNGQPEENAWQVTISNLTVEEGEWNEHGTQANYKIYSYYLEEVSTTPDNYRYSITDSDENVISPVNRLYNGDIVTATNTKIGDHIRIEKRWFRLVADEMPPVVVRVTQTVNNATTDVMQDAYDDFGNVVKYVGRQNNQGTGYSGYILDKNNGWAINLEGLEENVNRTYTEVGIIIDGDPSNNYEGGTFVSINDPLWTSLQFHPNHYYFNSDGIAPPEGSRNELISMYITTNGNVTAAVKGTMFIYNVPDEGYQLEVEKKWFQFSGAGGFENITSWYGREEPRNIAFIVQAQQMAYWHGPHTPETVAQEWTDYRDPLTIHYRANSTDTGYENVDPNENWLTVLKQYNFAKMGLAYHTQTGKYEAVDYEYRFVEVGIIEGEDGRLWSKSVESTNDPTVTDNDHRYRINNYEVGQIELQKQWKLDTLQQAEEVYFKIYSDWWFTAYGAEKAENGKYDVAEIIGRDINNPSLSQEEKTALEKYWLYNPENADNLTVKEIAGLGYVFALKGTSDLWNGSCVRGLPLLQADPSMPGVPASNGYGEVLYTVAEVGAYYNGNVVRVGDSSWPYVNPLYYRSVRGQGENLVSNGETFQIDNMRGEEPSYFKAVNSDIPTWRFHADKIWDKLPEQGADIVFELQVLKLKEQEILAIFSAYNETLTEGETPIELTAEQGAEGIKVSNLTPAQIKVLVDSNTSWYTAEVPNPSVVLPRSWDYVNMPESTEAEKAAKAAATSAAWSIDWAGLPTVWKNDSIQDPEEYELLYRVVETSSPAWTTHTISSLMVGANYDLSQTVMNRNGGEPGTVQITKTWDNSTDSSKWPEGYVINYKVIQHAYLADATVIEADEGSVAAQKGVQYTPNMDKPLFDSEDDAGFTDYTATYTENGESKAADPGTILKNQNPVTLHLPKGAMWTAPENEEDLTAEMKAAGIKAGKTYSIAYTYEVVETGVATNDQQTLPFTATSGELDISSVSEGTINNDTTKIKVVKVWNNYEPEDDDQIGVKLYVSTTAPGEKIQSTFTVKIGNWLNNTVAPESGSVEVNLVASDGSTKTVTMSAPDWSVPVTVNKYGNNENGPEVTWTIQSVGTPTEVPEGTMSDLIVWDGHNDATNSGALELQATGEERKNTGSIRFVNASDRDLQFIIEGGPLSSANGVTLNKGSYYTFMELVEGQQYQIKLNGFENSADPASTYPQNVVYQAWGSTNGYWVTATKEETEIVISTIPKANIVTTLSSESLNNGITKNSSWGDDSSAPIGQKCRMYYQWNGTANSINVIATGASDVTGEIEGIYNWGGKAHIDYTPTDAVVTLTITLTNSSTTNASNKVALRSVKGVPVAVQPTALAVTPTSTTVALKSDAGTSGTAVIVGQNDLPHGAEPVFGDNEIILNSQEDSTTGEVWSHLWDNLPKKDKDGKNLYYYVVETSTTVQGTTVTASYERTPASGDNPETITIKNTVEKPEYGSFIVIKEVEGAETDREFTIRLKREKDNTTTWLKYGVGDSTPSWGAETEATTWTFNAGGTVTFTGLDLGYRYTAVEDTGTGMVEISGYDFSSESSTTASVDVSAAQEYTGTITNKYTASAFIKIIKVEKGHKDTTHTLTSAEFQLTKVDSEGHDITGSDAYKSEVSTVDQNGELTFSGLRPGRYKLEEKKAPDGYVLVEGPWYFNVSAGTATLEGTYTLASARVEAGQPNEFWIENTPGAQLPQTGGVGTSLYTALGGLMTATAGAILTLTSYRRRKKQLS